MRAGPRRCLSPQLPPVKSVVVFRALKLGDMLCAVPAFRALRRGLPRARIALLALPWARQFAARFPDYIDEFIEFPGYPGLPERECRAEELALFLKTMRERNFDLALQMHGSGNVSNGLIASLGARVSAGFYPAEEGPRDREWYLPYPEGAPEIERNLALIRHLGFPSQGRAIEFPLWEGDGTELCRFRELAELSPGSYVCLHPGASLREKCWPPEDFAAVGKVIRQSGLAVVVTGNRTESGLAGLVAAGMGGGCIDAASRDLGLGALALLIGNSRLLICNDTGVSHLATALGVPSVVVFTSTDPVRWAPLDGTRHRSLGGPGRIPAREEVLHAARSLLSIEGEDHSCMQAP
ncbi:MAG: hypothetical protein A2078_16230 [Nitrospirae bacterium GWC2_57_9]|nr:MAG: hypothetical protein A2078_16230 [Nitrospirae bacterium GWC2_57_9]